MGVAERFYCAKAHGKWNMKYKKYIYILILVIISIIPLFDLFHSGLPITHDGQDHVARIANFYQNLQEGNVIPRWADNLNWGYGHPILEFLYPLPSYLASLFHILGFTLVDSMKLVFGASFILSGLVMYVFVKELLDDNKAAFFASTLYLIAPYRFVDLYVRGAIGEHVAFIFAPLIFYFLLKLLKKDNHWYVLGGAFSFAGLALSHNAITIMFLPLVLIYFLYLLFQCRNKKSYILNVLFMAVLGFGLSSFFLVPAFVEGKYTLRDIVTGGGEYAASFVNWRDFFFGQWNYGGSLLLSKQIGIIHWVSIIAGIISMFILRNKKRTLWKLTLGIFIIFWIALFLMTPFSNLIWQSITILQKFQFPWRFLSVTVFLSALMGGIILSLIQDKHKKVILLIFIIGLLSANKDYWHAQGFSYKSEIFYTGIYNGTTDTGESAPIWSVRFMDKRPVSKIEIINGEGKIKEIKRSFTQREYQAEAKGAVRILENTLYFPGWTVYVDGKPQTIEFQDQNYRGLITFYVNNGKHLISIIYKETRVREFSNIISLVSLIAVIGLSVFKSKVKKGYNKNYDKKA
jgi:uncharacterized membrane protein